MKKKMALFLAGGLFALSLTGCAENQIPDISDEQLGEMKNYVAAAMMKYNMGRKSRLVDLSKYTDLTEMPDELPDRPQGMDPVADTPVVDATGNAGTESSAPNASGNTETAYQIEEVLGFPEGVTIEFRDQEFCDEYYPSGGEEDVGFFMGASSSEKKLLVLHFQLTNASAEEKKLDSGFPEIIYHVTINGERARQALISMLPNDLATFEGSVPAGGSAEAVLIIEVEKDVEGNLDSVDLDIQKELKMYKFKLF